MPALHLEAIGAHRVAATLPEGLAHVRANQGILSHEGQRVNLTSQHGPLEATKLTVPEGVGDVYRLHEIANTDVAAKLANQPLLDVSEV